MNRFLFVFLGIFSLVSVKAQSPMPAKSAAEIQHMIKRLGVVGKALYIAAHPDDENQRMITYLAKGQGYETGYLSLTRGDGGQNLIGDEKGPSLGLLRTQELLAARRIDGGRQFFTRAYDFGYSKTPEETLTKWDKDAVLGDMVWVIRSFRPDVIITRFATPEKGGGGHGHHTTSAMLAHEAFALAADPKAFPEQLQYVAVWQAKRLFWNNYWVFRNYEPTEEEKANIIEVNVGEYDPLLGKSYGEIASEARSMHRCQAFGAALLRGSLTEYLDFELGDKPENGDIFSGVETTWARLGLPVVGELLTNAFQDFDPKNPAASIPTLLAAHKLIEKAETSGKKIDKVWVAEKRKELDQVILYCAGIWMEATTAQPIFASNAPAPFKIEILKRTNLDVTFSAITQGTETRSIDEALGNNASVQTWEFSLATGATGDQLAVTQPYWLSNPEPVGVFEVSDKRLIGMPENPALIPLRADFLIDGVLICADLPVIHRYVDRAVGELYRPVVIAPPLTVNVNEKVYLFADNQPKTVQLQARGNGPGSYEVTFETPEGWIVSPQKLDITINEAGQELPLSVTVTPPSSKSEGDFKVLISAEGMEPYSLGFDEIAYGHIPTQIWFPRAVSRLVRIDLKKRGNLIGYLEGSGDEVPKALQQVGYQVDIINPDAVTAEALTKYDAVVAGIRTYNTLERMPYIQSQILEYVKQGGTYVVQYQTSSGMKEDNPGPYPLKLGRDRITVEEAELHFIDPNHPLATTPNKITDADFDGWVQERGLYFGGEWDEQYTPILTGHDPDEKDLTGSTLVAQYGQGWYVYTGLSFFRELPAGVPGAFRLFVNMISLGKDAE